MVAEPAVSANQFKHMARSFPSHHNTPPKIIEDTLEHAQTRSDTLRHAQTRSGPFTPLKRNQMLVGLLMAKTRPGKINWTCVDWAGLRAPLAGLRTAYVGSQAREQPGQARGQEIHRNLGVQSARDHSTATMTPRLRAHDLGRLTSGLRRLGSGLVICERPRERLPAQQ